ncbi:hypothetical protein GP924_21085 [Enterobacteriaceae bacterium 8376wB9]|nr:hypothetical protein [Enterobacteriaceae bacterium 8376wB9]
MQYSLVVKPKECYNLANQVSFIPTIPTGHSIQNLSSDITIEVSVCTAPLIGDWTTHATYLAPGETAPFNPRDAYCKYRLNVYNPGDNDVTIGFSTYGG